MKARDWCEAHRAGALVHDWAELVLHDEHDRECRLRVSADAVRVREPGGDRVRRSAGAYACDQVAQLLGGHMLTPKLVDDRHHEASVILRPFPSGLIKPGGTIGNTTDREHSDAIDGAIARAVAFDEWGASPYQGRGPYREDGEIMPWLVSNTGKLFVLDADVTDTRGTNYGWLVHESETYVQNGVRFWMGVRVYPADWLTQFYVVQSSAQGHGFGELADQDDYSQLVVIADGLCSVDGVECPTAKLYTDPDLAAFVMVDGRPLRSARHPNVPAPEVAFDDAPETVPEWLNPTLPPRLRQLAWCLHHEGHEEQPMGSNNSPLIATWAKRCEREGVPGIGDWAAKTGVDWCAIFGTAGAIHETRLPGDPVMPIGYRLSGIETEQDAMRNGAWHAVADVLAGKWTPRPGDKVVFPRAGEPAGSWKRHFATVIDFEKGSTFADSIDGNRGNKVQRQRFAVSSALGFIEIPDDATAPESHDPITSQERIIEGVDVSYLQNPKAFDWSVVAQRFRFVIARVGFGKQPDLTFVAHVDGARAAGMRIGSYIFYRQTQSWREQFDTVTSQMSLAGLGVGDLYPAVDLETYEPTEGKTRPDVHNTEGRALVEALAERFGGCLVYLNPSHYAVLGEPEWVLQQHVWIAHQTTADEPRGPRDWAIWQTGTAKIAGFAGGPVDVNRARRLPTI